MALTLRPINNVINYPGYWFPAGSTHLFSCALAIPIVQTKAGEMLCVPQEVVELRSNAKTAAGNGARGQVADYRPVSCDPSPSLRRFS
jgi:hypothetical protein